MRRDYSGYIKAGPVQAHVCANAHGLFAALYEMAEAVGHDHLVPSKAQVAALEFAYRPGPVARCGFIVNTRKHNGRDPTKTFAVLVPFTDQPVVGGPIPQSSPYTFRKWSVEYTDPAGVETSEDGLALADAAYQEWLTFLKWAGLVQA
jgi:hypothetical protein